MALDKIKQQARLSIIERLRQKGTPISPFPGKDEEAPISEDEALSGEEESLNDFGLDAGLKARLMKKKPVASEV